MHSAENHSSRPMIPALLQRIRLLGLHRIPRIRDLMEWAADDPEDQNTLELLHDELAEEEERQQVVPDPFRPSMAHDATLLAGPLELGTIVQTGYRYGTSPDLLQQHMLCLGRSGGGKTTFITLLLYRILQEMTGVRVLILEHKAEFTRLARAFPGRLHTVDLQDLRLNVLTPPPGLTRLMWLWLLVQLMVDYLDIMVASSAYIVDAAEDLCRSWPELGNQKAPQPSLRHLYNHIAAKKHPAFSHLARYQETSVNRIGGLLNALPGLFEGGRGLDASAMLDENLLIHVHGIPNTTTRNFLVSLLATLLFFCRKVVYGHQPGLRHILVLDEAAGLFRRQLEFHEKPCLLMDLVAQARAFGIGIIGASQYGSDLSATVMANTATKLVIGGVERQEDLKEFIHSRPTSPEQADAIAGDRQPGHAYIADPRHPYLLQCVIDPLDFLPQAMTPEESLRASAEFVRQKERDQESITTPQAEGDTATSDQPVGSADRRGEAVTPDTAASPDDVLLRDIAADPFCKWRVRAGRLGLELSTLSTMVDGLEQRNIVRRYDVPMGAGRPRTLIEVTEAGYTAIHMPRPAQPGKGGFLHQWYQARVSQALSAAGYATQIEGRGDDKAVDIVATKKPDGEVLAVEIELHVADSRQFIKNLVEDAAASRFSRILCLVPTRAEQQRVQKAIRAEPALAEARARITVELLHPYIKEGIAGD